MQSKNHNQPLSLTFFKSLFITIYIFLQISCLYAQKNYFIHIGHATVFVHLDNVNILFDPNWNDNVLFVRRDNPPGLPLEDLPPVDIILISHSHFDHMDMYSLRKIHKINSDVKIFLPENLGVYLKEINITNYQELSTNEQVSYKNIKIKTFRASHHGSRFLFDNTPLAFCYLLKGTKTIFFSGDTAYNDRFKNIGETEKIDIAFMDIQGWKISNEVRKQYMSCFTFLLSGKYTTTEIPKQYPRHLSPQQAIQVLLDLKTEKMVPIHYDAFYTKFRKYRNQIDPLIELKQSAKKKNVEDKLIIKKLGTKIKLE